MAAKETPKTKKAKPQSRVKASAVTERPTYADLRQQVAESLEREKAALKDLQDRDQQLAESVQRESATARENVQLSTALNEALEQQTATGEILRVIASSGTDLQSCWTRLLKALLGCVIPLMPKSIASRAICSGR